MTLVRTRPAHTDTGSATPRPARRWVRYPVAGAVYLAGSVALWWHVWTAPGGPSSVMTCPCTDAGRGMWFIDWSAFALTHGHQLLHSTWQFHPTGFYLLDDVSIQAIGVVMTPVTLLFGPVTAFNLAATLTPALTALSMFWLLQRWVRWTPAAFVGGLAYGFSTFVVVQLAFGWLNLALAALLPLMAACLDELLIRRRRRPAVVGAALGLLVVVQFFVSSEVVLLVGVAVVVAVALVAGYAAVADRDALRRGARHAAVGLAVAAAVAAVLLAYPLWTFLAGPGHLSGTVWSTDVPGELGTTAANFWSRVGSWGPLPPGALASEVPILGGYLGPATPSLSYLGWGLLGVLAVGTAVWRRDRRLWLFGSLGVVLALCSLTVGSHQWGPWSLVYHLPLFRDAVQSRFSSVIDLCAAVMLAVVVGRTRDGVARWWEGRSGRAPGGAATVGGGGAHGVRDRARVVATVAAVVVAAVALVPVAAVLADNVPLTVQGVDTPTWFTSVAPTLPPDRVVATYPFATADSQSSIPWQAVAGMRYRMAGGGGPGGTVARAGAQTPGFAVLRDASVVFTAPPALTPAHLAGVRSALRAWGVTTVVVPDDAGLHRFEVGRGASYGVAFYTAVLGTAPVRQHGAWVWTRLPATPPVPLSEAAVDRCVALGAAPGATAGPLPGARVASCVLAAGAGSGPRG